MGKLRGAVLVVAGVMVAAYAMAERHRLAKGTASAVQQPPGTGATDASAAPGSGPQAQAKVDAPTPPGTQKPPAAPPTPPPAVEESAGSTTAVIDRKSARKPAPLQIAEAPPRVPVDHNEPARKVPLGQEGLTRAIQHHLRRAGCYGGAITGQWTPAVRQAMKAFTERVNATLPVEEPDDILLALVESHKDAACGRTCPAGQARDSGGRCQPEAIVAAAKKADARPSGEAGAPPGTRAGTPEEGVALAGPPPARKRAVRSRHYRYSHTRARDRRRAANPGMPWWAGPLFSP
jgi:hypothetical protein